MFVFARPLLVVLELPKWLDTACVLMEPMNGVEKVVVDGLSVT